MIKAIETSYKGFSFRSRLEARWAVFFDALGVKWEYEKEGYDLGGIGRYLPDFWLPNSQLWVEVKGACPTDAEKKKSQALSDHTKHPAIIVGNVGEVFEEYNVNTDNNTFILPVSLSHGYMNSFLKSNDPDGWGIHLNCPLCGYEYVHHGLPVYKDSDNYTAWAGRGSALLIPMSCEAGCYWNLRLGFHKGFTFFDIQDTRQTVEFSTLAVVAGRDLDKLGRAIDAARSARFEHGQSGAK